jgi:S-adenosylmethionine:tRNA-ribosyltransferase-isomerase (queuine synthetase)
MIVLTSEQQEVAVPEAIMQLIDELHTNDMDLVQYWKEGRDFWFNQHQEKDRLYWKEREKRIRAEKKLKEMTNPYEVVVNDASKIKVGKTILLGNEAMRVVGKEGNTLIVEAVKLKEMNDGRNELTGEDKRNGTGKTWEEEGNSGVISETGGSITRRSETK